MQMRVDGAAKERRLAESEEPLSPASFPNPPTPLLKTIQNGAGRIVMLHLSDSRAISTQGLHHAKLFASRLEASGLGKSKLSRSVRPASELGSIPGLFKECTFLYRIDGCISIIFIEISRRILGVRV